MMRVTSHASCTFFLLGARECRTLVVVGNRDVACLQAPGKQWRPVPSKFACCPVCAMNCLRCVQLSFVYSYDDGMSDPDEWQM